MRIRRAVPVLLIAVLAGCSSTSAVSSSSTPSAPPPVASSSGDLCASWSALKTSVSDLQKVNVVSGGSSAIQTALQNVQSKFDAFQSTARNDFAPQTTQMKDALVTLQSAVQALTASPGVGTIGGVVAAVTGVISAFNALQTAVSSRCG
jgi:hypothetical protein